MCLFSTALPLLALCFSSLLLFLSLSPARLSKRSHLKSLLLPSSSSWSLVYTTFYITIGIIQTWLTSLCTRVCFVWTVEAHKTYWYDTNIQHAIEVGSKQTVPSRQINGVHACCSQFLTPIILAASANNNDVDDSTTQGMFPLGAKLSILHEFHGLWGGFCTFSFPHVYGTPQCAQQQTAFSLQLTQQHADPDTGHWWHTRARFALHMLPYTFKHTHTRGPQ